MKKSAALTGLVPASLAGKGGETVLAAVREGDAQYVTTRLHINGYDDVQVAAGDAVVWTIVAEEGSLNGCNNELVLPAFDQQVCLQEGENVITYTPERVGRYVYSCWMGMLRNTITVVET
ncbi:exported hypothetical protein [uncultured Eubacteriales bacterium]|uniref:EfeO-type cupredoxin-like domain-containing protein n=1 Tax=uncultured Eubacteriales bacterium TaxID=172733 RepID=A0A212JC52_9FIRM|nr:exported hypothetical protein [uncultured Eubacteriales bacterium]